MATVPKNLIATDSITYVAKKTTAKKLKIESFSNFGERITSLFEIQPIAEASPEIQILLQKVKQLVLSQQNCIDSLSFKWKQGDEKLARVEERWKKELKDARDRYETLQRTINSYEETVHAKDKEIQQLNNQLVKLEELLQVLKLRISEQRNHPEQLESINIHLPVAETSEKSREYENLADTSGSGTDQQQSQISTAPIVNAEAGAESDRAAAEHFVRYDLEATKGELQKCKTELREVSSERDKLKVQVDHLLEALKRSDKEVLDALDKTTGPQQARGDEVTGTDVTALFSLINLTHRFLGIACAQVTPGLPIPLTTSQLAMLNSNSGGSFRAATADEVSGMTTESAVSYLSSRISAKGSLVSSQLLSDTSQLNHTNKIGRTTNQSSGASQIGPSERSNEFRVDRSTLTDLHEVEEPDQALGTLDVSRFEGTSLMDTETLKEALTKLNQKYNQKKRELRKMKEQLKESTDDNTTLQVSLIESFKERDDYASQIANKSTECEELKAKIQKISDDLSRNRSAAEEYKQTAVQQMQSLQQQLFKAVEESQWLRTEVQTNKNVKLELERVKSDLRQVSASTNMTSAQIAGLSKTTRDTMGLSQQSMHSSAESGVDSSKSSKKPPSNH